MDASLEGTEVEGFSHVILQVFAVHNPKVCQAGD